MSTFVGRADPSPAPVAAPAPAPAAEKRSEPSEQAREKQAAKTRAELIEEAEELGIDIPRNANKAQIQKLIDEAPVI